MDGWMDGWMDGGMEGWRDGGMEGWDGWMVRMDGVEKQLKYFLAAERSMS